LKINDILTISQDISGKIVDTLNMETIKDRVTYYPLKRDGVHSILAQAPQTTFYRRQKRLFAN